MLKRLKFVVEQRVLFMVRWQGAAIQNFRIGPSLLNRIGTSDSNSKLPTFTFTHAGINHFSIDQHLRQFSNRPVTFESNLDVWFEFEASQVPTFTFTHAGINHFSIDQHLRQWHFVICFSNLHVQSGAASSHWCHIISIAVIFKCK